jgi:hypothetical protein
MLSVVIVRGMLKPGTSFPCWTSKFSPTVPQTPRAGDRISENEIERVSISFLACVKNAGIIRDSISGVSFNLQALPPDLFNDLQEVVR